MNPRQDVLSRDEITQLLRRNQAEPLPEYEQVWAGARRLPQTDADAAASWAKYLGRLGSLRTWESHAGWLIRLDSRTWRVQVRGAKEAQVCTRTVRVSKGNQRTYTEVALNSRLVG